MKNICGIFVDKNRLWPISPASQRIGFFVFVIEIFGFPLEISELVDKATPISKSQHTKEKQQWLFLVYPADTHKIVGFEAMHFEIWIIEYNRIQYMYFETILFWNSVKKKG